MARPKSLFVVTEIAQPHAPGLRGTDLQELVGLAAEYNYTSPDFQSIGASGSFLLEFPQRWREIDEPESLTSDHWAKYPNLQDLADELLSIRTSAFHESQFAQQRAYMEQYCAKHPDYCTENEQFLVSSYGGPAQPVGWPVAEDDKDNSGCAEGEDFCYE